MDEATEHRDVSSTRGRMFAKGNPVRKTVTKKLERGRPVATLKSALAGEHER
jgi:hypothetical protein